MVLALDRGCVPGCAVSIRSLLENADPHVPIRIHVICDGVGDTTRARLARSSQGAHPDAEMLFHDLDPGPVSGLTQSKLIPRSAYAKLLLDRLIPTSVSRLIFIDCDLLFERDAHVLWNTDLGERTVGATRNGGPEETRSHAERLHLPEPQYFNSGVLLVDLDRWRDLDVASRALGAARRFNTRLILHDQDALNVALACDWTPIDDLWNAWVILPDLDPEAPTVLHFMGAPKPWDADCDRPFVDRFYGYLDRTDFAGWRPWNPVGIGALLRRTRRRVPYLPGAVRLVRDRLSPPTP